MEGFFRLLITISVDKCIITFPSLLWAGEGLKSLKPPKSLKYQSEVAYQALHAYLALHKGLTSASAGLNTVFPAVNCHCTECTESTEHTYIRYLLEAKS